MVENYILKTEKEPFNFERKDERVYLREYQPFLVFYASMTGNKADYCIGDNSSLFEDEPVYLSGGPFGSYYKLKDKYSFKGENIIPLKNQGRISFWLGANNKTKSHKIALSLKNDTLPAGSYSFKISVQDNINQDVKFSISKDSTEKEIGNKISFTIDPTIFFCEADYNEETNKIEISTVNKQSKITLLDGTDGDNLLDYVNVENITYGYSPNTEKLIAEISNFKIYHFTDENGLSKLKVVLYDKDDSEEFIVDWDNNGKELDNIEIDFDKTVIYIFVNGKLKKCEVLQLENKEIKADINLYGYEEDPYSFDELIINSKVYHRYDFELPKTKLTKYTTEKPYIDYSFYGANISEGDDLFIESSNNIHSLISYNSQYYYYYAGSWRKSDGSYEQSNDVYTFRDRIPSFPFDGENFFIRLYFASDGTDPAWVGRCYFDTTEEDDTLGTEDEAPAILVGEKEFDEDEEIDLKDKELIITTDQGTSSITFDSNLTIDKVIQKLLDLYPEGIAKIYKDNLGRIVLISDTKGSDAYISVSGDAADILFGDTKTAQGSDAKEKEIDYNSYLEMVRKDAGAPNLIWEITDEQMLDYLKEGIEYYNRYNQGNFSTYSVQLEGNSKDGYKIPSIIQTPKDIVDIIFKPIFPLNFYAGADFGDTEDIISLSLVNSLFGGTGGARGKNIAADFYISLMSIQDFKQTLGIEPKWEILNKRIYIYPNNISRFTHVCIKYKSAISLEEAMRSPEMKLYVTGRCYQTMAAIRGQYGAQVTTGAFALTLNADIMFQRGTDMINQALNYWKGCDEPFMILG